MEFEQTCTLHCDCCSSTLDPYVTSVLYSLQSLGKKPTYNRGCVQEDDEMDVKCTYPVVDYNGLCLLFQTLCLDVYRGLWGGAKCRDSPAQAQRECNCSPGE